MLGSCHPLLLLAAPKLREDGGGEGQGEEAFVRQVEWSGIKRNLDRFMFPLSTQVTLNLSIPRNGPAHGLSNFTEWLEPVYL